MTVTVNIKGVKEVQQMLERKRRQIDQNADVGINKATFFIQGEVKSSIAGQRAEPTSVDTGRFLNSIDVETRGNTGRVFTDVEYSKILEFGGTNRKPRKHFTNTVFRNKD